MLNLLPRPYKYPVGTRPKLNHPQTRGLILCWLLNEVKGTNATDCLTGINAYVPSWSYGASSYGASSAMVSNYLSQADIPTWTAIGYIDINQYSHWSNYSMLVCGPQYYNSAGDDCVPGYQGIQGTSSFKLIAYNNDNFSNASPNVRYPLSGRTQYALTADGTYLRGYVNGAMTDILPLTPRRDVRKQLLLVQQDNTLIATLDTYLYYDRALASDELVYLLQPEKIMEVGPRQILSIPSVIGVRNVIGSKVLGSQIIMPQRRSIV